MNRTVALPGVWEALSARDQGVAGRGEGVEGLREKGVLPTEGKRRTEKGTEGRKRAVRKGNRDGSVRLDTRGGVLGCESGDKVG